MNVIMTNLSNQLRLIMLTFCVFAGMALPLTANEEPGIQPNILFIMIDDLGKVRKRKRQARINRFSEQDFDHLAPFTRLGHGSVGGKGRGIASVASSGSRTNSAEREAKAGRNRKSAVPTANEDKAMPSTQMPVMIEMKVWRRLASR